MFLNDRQQSVRRCEGKQASISSKIFCRQWVSMMLILSCSLCCPTQTRMQGTKASQYANTLDCFKQIIANEGVAAFYAGLLPRLGRVVPGQGIIFMSFETIVQNLEKFPIFQ